MKIIRVRKENDIDVQFLDEYGYIKRNITHTAFKLGQVKNPYDKTIYGIGYLGVGCHKPSLNKINTQEYTAWYSMIERCYSENRKHKNPAYFDIATVCKEWHNFQCFSDWYVANKYNVSERLHIDKDILVSGNKFYSAETCLLVPQRINMLFTTHRPNKYGLPEGISLTSAGRYGVSYQGKSFGTYKTLEEACLIHAQKKEEVIKLVAKEYINIIPKRLYDVLCSYKVDMEKYINRNS